MNCGKSSGTAAEPGTACALALPNVIKITMEEREPAAANRLIRRCPDFLYKRPIYRSLAVVLSETLSFLRGDRRGAAESDDITATGWCSPHDLRRLEDQI